MPKKVVIAGAGIVGLSAAYFLNKAGLDVTIIDQTDGEDNCSYGNAGYISPSHLIPLASPGIISQGLKWMLDSKSPFYIKPRFDLDLFRWGWLFKKASADKRVKAAIPVLADLAVRSKELYERILDEEKIEAGYNDKGLLMICQTESALRHEIELVEAANALGLEASQLTREETEELEPNVKYDMAGSLFFGCDSCMTPDVFMEAFKKLLKNQGVQFQFGTKLTDIETNRNGKIQGFISSGTSYHADEYIMSIGAWSPSISKQLGIRIPMQAGKGYSFSMENLTNTPKLPSILVEARIATTPMLHGLRIAGTMELSGINHHINPSRILGITEAVKKAMPEYSDYDFESIRPWAGLRPCTPDGLPYIGRTNAYDNLQIGTGHAMLGWTLGPVTGQILANNILGIDKAESSLINVERYG